jgi:nitroreductase / dihydropteridine reductase
MEFKNIVKERYATKKFDGRIIPDEKINELFEIIRMAASSSNMKTWKIKVITDKKTKELLLPATYNQPQIMSCSHLLVFCADTDLTGKLKKITDLMRKEKVPEQNIEGYKSMVEGMLSMMPSKEAQRSWSQRQLFLALGNAVNGAKSLGFDSCPMEGFNPVEYSKILKLPENIVPTALCTLGYAADTPRPKLRLSKEDVFF